MLREVVECCPHCGGEEVFEWDVETNGYVVKCLDCGNEMMLCDECLHSDDNKCQKCDWHKEGNMSVCFRGRHELPQSQTENKEQKGDTKMNNVFNYVFCYTTKRGCNGVVRADNLSEAKEKLDDFYNKALGLNEITSIICLSGKDNGYGVIEFPLTVM